MPLCCFDRFFLRHFYAIFVWSCVEIYEIIKPTVCLKTACYQAFMGNYRILWRYENRSSSLDTEFHMDYLICKVINGRESTVFSPNHSIIAYRALYHKGKTKKIKEIRENAGAAQPCSGFAEEAAKNNESAMRFACRFVFFCSVISACLRESAAKL